MKLPARERFAAILMFSNSPIDGVLYSQVLDYLDNLENNTEPFDDDDRINSNILHALHNNEPVRHMHIEGLNNLIQAIFAKFEDQTPGKAAISQFIKRWLENPGKREEMVPSKTSSLNTSDNIESPKVAPLRGYKHTYATLDQEIAVALLPISPDTPVLSGNLRDAEKSLQKNGRILNAGQWPCVPLRRSSNMTDRVFLVLYRTRQLKILTISQSLCGAILIHG